MYFVRNPKRYLAKNVFNIQELKTRNGKIIGVTSEEHQNSSNHVNDLMMVPDTDDAHKSILATIPLQLLAYYMAKARGCDIDKPRNLAKSVTVE
jgi:glucosamine--fructose-6-phosphate aminotransferase (isomerizing)